MLAVQTPKSQGSSALQVVTSRLIILLSLLLTPIANSAMRLFRVLIASGDLSDVASTM